MSLEKKVLISNKILTRHLKKEMVKEEKSDSQLRRGVHPEIARNKTINPYMSRYQDPQSGGFEYENFYESLRQINSNNKSVSTHLSFY